VPSGQHLTADFPVLSAGSTREMDLKAWSFRFAAVPRLLPNGAGPTSRLCRRQGVDVYCATTWSKLDTKWQGVMIDTLLEAAGLSAPPTSFALVHSERDYTTNVPVEDLVDGKAMVATQPLASEHGGPARLLVPHLYFWKSAKWARRLQFIQDDEPGFW
jgi:molybdopterin-dependent oxidoreductase-like protein protein